MAQSTETKITKKFIEENINEILSNLRPSIMLEYLSKRFDSVGQMDTTGWNVQIRTKTFRGNRIELLGEYQNGKLISGKWFDQDKDDKDMHKLHTTLKLEAKNQSISFDLYLNKLLCKGKQNEGISWHEYDSLMFIERHGSQ